MVKNRIIIALFTCCALATAAFPVRSEEMLCLVVRPELLNRSKRLGQAPLPGRNIFAWPAAAKSAPGLSEQRRADESAVTAMKSLKAEAILWNRSKPLAIINGNLVGVGDELSGIRVLAIRKDSITLEKRDIQQGIGFETVEINLGTGKKP